jgi:hypothetical protein
MYLKNDITEEIGVFMTSQEGWSEATQEEIDAFLLAQAKTTKIDELKEDLKNFCDNGYAYTGDIVCAAYDSEITYALNALVLGSDSKNYISLQADNTGHDPTSSPEWWEEFIPEFKTDDCCMINLTTVTDNEYYTKRTDDLIKHKINFGDSTNWDAFVTAMHTEKDRIMKKYQEYDIEINNCSTVAAVDAIVIDFSE